MQYVYLLNKYIKCNVWRLAVRYDTHTHTHTHTYIYIYITVFAVWLPHNVRARKTY
jgi:hypothetical protein